MSGRDARRQLVTTDAVVSSSDGGPLSPYYARAYAAAQQGLGYLAGASGAGLMAGSPDTTISSNTDRGGEADPANAIRLPRSAVASTMPELAAVGTVIDRSSSNDGSKVTSSTDDARRKDSRNLDSIVAQAHTKAAQIIAQARLTHPPAVAEDQRSGAYTGRTSVSATSVQAKRARNRWFNIEMDELDIFREELKTWRSVTSVLSAATNASTSASSSVQSVNSRSSGPSSQSSIISYAIVPVMIIEVILDCSELSANQVLVLNQPQGCRVRIDLSGTTSTDQRRASADNSTTLRKQTIVLERWTMALRPPVPTDPPDLPTVYKHCIILFRALYTLVRALPVYEFYRRQRRRSSRSDVKICCRMSTLDTSSVQSDTGPLERSLTSPASSRSEIGLEQILSDSDGSLAIQEYRFSPVVTPFGSLELLCRYRTSVDFSVEEVEAMLSSRFIDEDFFQPTIRKYSSGSGGPAGSVPIQDKTAVMAPPAGVGSSQQTASHAFRAASPRSQPVQIDHNAGAFVSQRQSVQPGSVLQRIASQSSRPGTPSDLLRRQSVASSLPSRNQSYLTSMPPTPGVSYESAASGGMVRISSSPGSAGPPSSLRHATFVQNRSISGSPGMGEAMSTSSGLSYTKRSISQMHSGTPPISALTAMDNRASPPGRSASAPIDITQRRETASSTGLERASVTSSTSSSLLQRYAYGRSTADRATSTRWPSSLSASPSDIRPRGVPPQSHGRPSFLTVSDADAINDFLGMLDAQPQLSFSRIQSTNPAQAPQTSLMSKTLAEQKLRTMAESVYRSTGSISPADTASRLFPSVSSGSRPPSVHSQHSRTRSGELTVGATRHSPASFSYETSPVESGGSPVLGSAGVPILRHRASQAPMSSSIPEESSYANEKRPSPPVASGSVGSTGASPSGAQFPFPRYVPASVRRRGSSQSSAHRPSLLGLHSEKAGDRLIADAASPFGASHSSSALVSSPEQSRQPTPSQSRYVSQGSRELASPDLPYESTEEQLMAQLDLSEELAGISAGSSDKSYSTGERLIERFR